MTRTAAEVAAAANFGTPTARKTGRNPKCPYVPVIKVVDTSAPFGGHTSQVLRRAFATREEAIADAEAYIARQRALLERKLNDPCHRALREHYGLPRELA